MNRDRDGGPAFPHVGERFNHDIGERETVTIDPGMTLRDYFAAKAMAARAEITREQVEGLPRKLFDVASRIRAGESLHRDDEMVDQAAHAIKAALVLPLAPQPAPLTDDQVAEEWFEVYALPISPRERAILFGRAIERAHGIGSKA